MSNKPTISLGADHAGYTYKNMIADMLREEGYAVTDHGTHSADSVDYPDFVHPVAEDIEEGRAAFGILVCGSANGVAMAANKHQGIRAAIAWENDLAALARQHNNANILCLPERFISPEAARQFVHTFLSTDFEGGRHERRVSKISCKG